MKRLLSLLLISAMLFVMLPTASAKEIRKPIYVDDLAVDYMAEVILDRLELESLPEIDKIRTVYDWIIANSERYEWDGEYRFSESEVLMESRGSFAQKYRELLAEGQILVRQDWEDISGLHSSDYYGYCLDTTWQVASQAYTMMLKMTGSCAAFTSLFTVLLGHLGYDSRLFHGEFVNMDGSQVEHTWNYVLIDGTWYWFDIRIDHAIGGGHQYFMKEDTEAWAKEHIWNEAQSDWLVANTAEISALYAPESRPDELPQDAPAAEAAYTCSDWAAGYMEAALFYDLIPMGLLQADLTAPITRQEFAETALLLYTRFTGLDIPAYEGLSPFLDTEDPQILKAYSLGLVNGMGDGTFAPDATLTREQASTMLGRAYELASQGVLFDGAFLPQSEEAFYDQGSISHYAVRYIGFFVGQQIIDGMGDGTFRPQDTMTREQALKIAAVCVQNLQNYFSPS
ncbi:MAG: S-layer homology domain-containing protein [Oscillospiraceae bacterium]|nr:S-layer homology domain-containing protein [Oscillospiraceae bacterium]